MDQQTVARVAALARLDLHDAQKKMLETQLTDIIGFVEQLSEINTDNITPLSSVVDSELPLRKDEVTDGQKKEDVLANNPEENEDFYVVTKIIE